ncbi:MAG: hypothetical protein JWP80_2238 [Pseudomonas sp.]|nr:hypothetical protein [Pseudomonas sp.]
MGVNRCNRFPVDRSLRQLLQGFSQPINFTHKKKRYPRFAGSALSNRPYAKLLLTTSYTSLDKLPEARMRSSSAFINA